jgi:putative membrane protein
MRSSRHRHRHRDIWKGAATGALAGLVGSWTMNQFQGALSKVNARLKPQPQSSAEPQPQSQPDNEDATMKAAERIAEGLLHRHLSKPEKQKLGPLVHYGFGTVAGAVYGAVAEVNPRASAGHGILFGSVLFAGADEIAVPALHLSRPATDYPVSTHAQALAAHCVYGLSTETVRELVRRVW